MTTTGAPVQVRPVLRHSATAAESAPFAVCSDPEGMLCFVASLIGAEVLTVNEAEAFTSRARRLAGRRPPTR